MQTLGLLFQYSSLWNITGFPAGIIPITKVQEDEQTYTDDINDTWTKAINEDCKNSKGMPISIQVVGYANEDEKVLGVMKLLAEKIQY